MLLFCLAFFFACRYLLVFQFFAKLRKLWLKRPRPAFSFYFHWSITWITLIYNLMNKLQHWSISWRIHSSISWRKHWYLTWRIHCSLTWRIHWSLTWRIHWSISWRIHSSISWWRSVHPVMSTQSASTGRSGKVWQVSLKGHDWWTWQIVYISKGEGFHDEQQVTSCSLKADAIKLYICR